MSATPCWRRILQRRLEALTRVVPAVAFGWMAAGYLSAGGTFFFRHIDAPLAPATLANLVSILSIAGYNILIAWLFVVRLRPMAKSEGWMPRAVALAGGFLPLALVALPRDADLSVAAKFLSSLLVVGGTLGSITILRQLDRSFSIMPEARRLVTRGAYAHVRHPLYLAEAVATSGALIQFWSGWAVLIVTVQFGFQFLRMCSEERVLHCAFPEYAAYSRVTPRLMPRFRAADQWEEKTG